MTRIIVVEDDLDQQEELLAFLSHSGHEVRGADSARQLAECLAQFTPEVVLLDYNLAGPDETGLHLVRDLRKRHGTAVGIVMVTGRGTSHDRVECRSAGADDYLIKPIVFAELLAVIDNLSARLLPLPAQRPWRLLLTHSVLSVPDGPSVVLTGWELMVLEAMARADNHLIGRQSLITALGKKPWAYDDRALETGISRLRKKLPTLSDGRMPIHAVRGTGYRFAHALVLVC